MKETQCESETHHWEGEEVGEGDMMNQVMEDDTQQSVYLRFAGKTQAMERSEGSGGEDEEISAQSNCQRDDDDDDDIDSNHSTTAASLHRHVHHKAHKLSSILQTCLDSVETVDTFSRGIWRLHISSRHSMFNLQVQDTSSAQSATNPFMPNPNTPILSSSLHAPRPQPL